MNAIILVYDIEYNLQPNVMKAVVIAEHRLQDVLYR